MGDTTFDLFDLDEPVATTQNATAPQVSQDLDQWVDAQVGCKASGSEGAVFYDLESGPLPEEELRVLFHEKSAEEFAADCDKRWKPDTVAAKYEEYKVQAWQEFVDRAALSPVTGRVLLIGTLYEGQATFYDLDDEAANLQSFWHLTEHCLASKIVLIGHNSNGFDLPFLVRRSWLLGVAVPREVRQGRYWHPLFRDTMEAWSCGGRDFVKLNVLGQAFGVGQKTEGVCGGDFHKLWFGTMDAEKWGTAEEQRAKALEYNAQDIRLTAAVAAKMGMV